MARILIVDDQESILKTAEAILKRAGYEVYTASDGYIALEKISIFTFDLLITDANMPGISGFDLVKSLRMGEKTRHMPIIMLTSRQEKRDVEKAIQAKVDDYVIKPIDPETLVIKVTSMLANASAGAKNSEAQIIEEGDLKLGVKVTAITEQGINLLCSQILVVGSVIPVSSALFEKIGIAAQEVRVISCHALGNGFVVLTQFAGIRPGDLAKLRDWLKAQPAKAS